MTAAEELTPQVKADVRATLEALKAVAGWHRDAGTAGRQEFGRIADWVVGRRGEEELGLLEESGSTVHP